MSGLEKAEVASRSDDTTFLPNIIEVYVPDEPEKANVQARAADEGIDTTYLPNIIEVYVPDEPENVRMAV